MSALTQVGSELGVDPKILGVAKEGQKMLSGEKSFSAEYAMQQVMEFIPIPMVIEKLTPIPQAVPINSGRMLFRQTQHLLAVECSNGNYTERRKN